MVFPRRRSSQRTDSQLRVSQQSGFSLMELLVALTVTVIGIMGLLTVHVSAIKGNQYTSQVAEANVVAKETLEELRGMTIAQIETQFSALPLVNVTMDTVSGRANQVYSRRLNALELTLISPDLVRFRIDVTWTDDGAVAGSDNGIHDHSVSLEAVRTRPGEPVACIIFAGGITNAHLATIKEV